MRLASRSTAFRTIKYGALAGMGIICGGRVSYVTVILNRDDKASLKQDMESVGSDMWAAIDKVDNKHKDELVNG